MTQSKKLVFSWMLILAMAISVISPGTAAYVRAEENAYKTTLVAATQCLHDKVTAEYGAEWTLIQLSRGVNEDTKWFHTYYDSLMAQLADAEKTADMKVGDWARVILTLEALGVDPANAGGKNLFANLADFTKINTGSIYDVPTMAYIVMGLGSRDDSVFAADGISADNQTTKKKLTDTILSYYDAENKCWGAPDWYTNVWTPDPDISAQAIQGLASYYAVNDTVKAAADNSLATLAASQQDENGRIMSYGAASACSTAQVVCALTAIGIDPAADSRFTKNGKTIMDGLVSFFDAETGGVKSAWTGELDLQFDTVQAGYALSAYDRFVNGKTFLLDLSDVTAPIYHYGGTATCVKKAVCEQCGQEYGEVDSGNHGKTTLKNAKDATCTEAGYAGDKVCDDCGEIVEKGTEIAKIPHTVVEDPEVPATATAAGKTKGSHCSVCGTVLEAQKEIPALGTLTTEYKVTSADAANPTVEYDGPEDATVAALVIPDTVTDANGVEYKVTKIADDAFKGNSALTELTIGANITEIGKNAFTNCANLKTVTVNSSSITKIGANAFSGDKKLTTVDLSKSKVTSIGKNAFSGCKKLKTIKINANKLSTVGKNAFKNVKKNAKITIYAKNEKTYDKVVKKLEKSGAKSVKYVFKKKK